jgi:hypothetical protein
MVIILSLGGTTLFVASHILTQFSPSAVNVVLDSADETQKEVLPFTSLNLRIAMLV